MKILAIDTSSSICSVSVLEDKKLISEKISKDEKNHSIKLMPLIDELFKETKLSLDDINLLACAQGPGSFTGIRIGIATVKAFSDAKDIPVCGVTSLESLAYNVTENGLIVSLIDAKNDNVYCSIFKNDNLNYTQKDDYISDNIQNVLNVLAKFNEPIIFVGNGATAHKDLILNAIPNSIFVNEELNEQTSVSVGMAAFNYYQNGIYGDSNSISPIYLKKSQAERQLDGEK